jgi:hypothetical protein
METPTPNRWSAVYCVVRHLDQYAGRLRVRVHDSNSVVGNYHCIRRDWGGVDRDRNHVASPLILILSPGANRLAPLPTMPNDPFDTTSAHNSRFHVGA